MQLSREEFETLVEKALADIPEFFREKLDNVVITVEDEPDIHDQMTTGRVPGQLLGLYHGVPLTQRGCYLPSLPDRITLYQRAIEAVGQTREGILKQIRRTVFHEIAHFFGISDERLREMERY
jgi:predicted Zn-dependent protease with MMP-like domain